MASTYTINTGIELIANGEQSGTWGDTTNTNLQIVDRLTSGIGAITLSGTTHTLQTTDGSLSEGQYKVLVFGGTPSGTNTVTVAPNDQGKQYFVVNNSGQTVVIAQGSGSTVTIEDGQSDIIFCDGNGSAASVSSFATDLAGLLTSANNLSDLSDADAAIVNLGITATATELNYVDGVTSGIQAQLDTKLSTIDLSSYTGDINMTGDLSVIGNTNMTGDLSVIGDTNMTGDLSVIGDTNFTGEVVADSYNEKSTTLSGTTPTIDCEASNFFELSTTGNTTFTFSGAPESGKAFGFTLKLTAGGTHTLTWPASVDWEAGNTPDAPSSGETNVYVFITNDVGTTWYGFVAGADLS